MGVKQLSRAEKIELLKSLEEKERRDRRKVGRYTPNPGQMPVHTSQKPVRAVFSGNGAGKTCMGANEVIWALDGYNPVLDKYTPSPVTGIVVLDSPEKVKEPWLTELQKWAVIEEDQMKKDGKPYIVRIVWPNGSQLKFMFHDQDDSKFESLEVDFLVFDEPPPRSKYVALLRGQRKIDSQPWTLFLGTPLAAAWMRREIYEPWMNGTVDHIDCFRFSTDVNKDNINWDHYEKIYFATLSEQEIKIRRHGEFFDLSGLALAHLWKRDVHVIQPFEWKREWPCIAIVDPHPSKANVAVVIGTDRDGNFYAMREMASRTHAGQFAYELNDFISDLDIRLVVCDSLGSTPTSGGDGDISFIDKLNQVALLKGFRWQARATTYHEKDDEAFIETLRDILYVSPETGKPKFFVFEDCIGVIADIENVEWEKHRNKDIQEPKKKLAIGNRDYLACCKYGFQAQMAFKFGRPTVKRTKSKSPWSGAGRSGFRGFRR